MGEEHLIFKGDQTFIIASRVKHSNKYWMPGEKFNCKYNEIIESSKGLHFFLRINIEASI